MYLYVYESKGLRLLNLVQCSLNVEWKDTFNGIHRVYVRIKLRKVFIETRIQWNRNLKEGHKYSVLVLLELWGLKHLAYL